MIHQHTDQQRPGLAIHVAISGFTQGYGRWHGIAELAEKLRSVHGRGCGSRVHYFRWNENWRAVAEYFFALSERYDRPLVIAVYAYSWGGGWGAMQLARELRRRGIRVRVMVLSDPVYCHPYDLLRWRALMNWNLPIVGEPIIRVPSTVDEVFSFHQIGDRPAGHKLISDSRTNGATIHPRVLLDCDHGWMDSAQEFHAQALDVALAIAREAAGYEQVTCDNIDQLQRRFCEG